ncbi:MAG: type II toxin-antitoxin system RelE/ParE family toxin [Vulcanimicrobiaceae bacterium]
MSYRLTRSAERELGDIPDYIAAGSPQAADRLEPGFFEAFEGLAETPGADLTDPPLRFFTVRGTSSHTIRTLLRLK